MVGIELMKDTRVMTLLRLEVQKKALADTLRLLLSNMPEEELKKKLSQGGPLGLQNTMLAAALDCPDPTTPTIDFAL